MSLRKIAVCVVLAGAAAGGILYWRAHRQAQQRVVLLISIDTQRPDRLGLYGNGPDVSPVLDALGPQSLVFDQALANSPYTLPSHMTMLTGLDPIAHGVKRDGCRLSTRVVTLAEALHADGFKCGAFTDGGYVSARYGFSQGFDTFDDHRREEEGATNGMARIAPLALDWLDKNADEDIFLFVHTFDVHAPYQEGDPEVHERFRQRPVQDGPQDHELHRLSYMHQQASQKITDYGRMAELLNDYDAGVFEADRGIGQILDKLKQQGRFEDALIIVTSDHGESFADHGIHVGHGIGLTDDELHIPLVLKLPRAEAGGRRLPDVVSLIDIPPTVLDVLGLPVVPEMQGDSLLDFVRGAPRRRDYVFGYSPNTESHFLVRDGWKCITPPSVPPLDVAHRHLGPTTPPDGGLAADHGEDYTFGHEPDSPVLHYDDVADPLGIRAVILPGFRLFDRAQDPRERVNLWDQHREDRGQAMTAFASQLMSASLELNKNLEDGTTPPPLGQVHVNQQLNQLGYAGALNQQQQQQYLASLPAHLRQALQHPYTPPDAAGILLTDRIMQLVRMALRDGRKLPPGYGANLKDCADRLIAWALANPDHKAEVGWRLYELSQLAEQIGVDAASSSWLGRYRDWLKQAERDATSSTGQGPDGSETEDGPNR